jgi:ppGpp synthetase/RelA/SpoT-type nucleotidyltranferase
MDFSQGAIRKLGKRIRGGSRDINDLRLLESFRKSHDSLLLEVCLRLTKILSETQVKFLISGRPKRTKSIIRKLERPESKGMDLFRLGDLVGLRIIVANIEAQDICNDALEGNVSDLKKKDYRVRPEGYRAVHYLISENKKKIEIQTRTLIQHLWAEESESFGEKVKEGGGSREIKNYLSNLSSICYRLENGLDAAELMQGEMLKKRNPIQGKLQRLSQEFKHSTKTTPDKASSVIVVFDNGTREQTQAYNFNDRERDEALDYFQNLSSRLPPDRFDVVILNACNESSPKVTHSRLYI